MKLSYSAKRGFNILKTLKNEVINYWHPILTSEVINYQSSTEN